MIFSEIDTELGALLVASDEEGLRQIQFQNGNRSQAPAKDWKKDPDSLKEEISQLKAYFAGELREFDLRLAPQGTPFQLLVWRALAAIPYGETISYGELAKRVGKPSAARAVGAANGRNPLPIVLPCHRVIGRNGSLVGYGGGLHRKKALLEAEHRRSSSQRQLFR